MEKQLENATQNQDKPTRKPNSKSIKNHWEIQPKNSSNSLENPTQTILNGKLTWKTQWTWICCSTCCHYCCPICSHRVFHCCHQIFHCYRRLGVGGEGSLVGGGRRRVSGPGEREAELAEGWGGGSELDWRWQWAGWGGCEGESERKRESSERAEKKSGMWK